MFAAIAVVALWLGWSLSYVRQREAALKYLPSNGASVQTSDAVGMRPWRRLPVTWRFFGAKPISRIMLYDNAFSEDDQARIQALFPEASVTLHRLRP